MLYDTIFTGDMIKMIKSQYTDEYKKQIMQECRETGNVALVAIRYKISPNTVHTWRSATRKSDSTKPLSNYKDQRQKATEKWLQELITENDNLNGYWTTK